MKSILITITGTVQGVGFRWSTKHLAQKHHITGWVRNETDGSVTIRAQGHSKDVAAFLENVQKGPTPLAYIDQVKVTPQPVEHFNQFDITN